MAGYPLHRENRVNGQGDSLSGKTQGIWNFSQNTGNLVCPSCKFPDFKDNSIFPTKIPKFFKKLDTSQFCVCNSHEPCKLTQGKFAVRQEKNRENTGNLKMQFELVPWYGP